MNSKKCKLMRKFVRLRTSHLVDKVSYVVNREGTVFVDPYSSRGIYRNLKRRYNGKQTFVA